MAKAISSKGLQGVDMVADDDGLAQPEFVAGVVVLVVLVVVLLAD